MLNPFASPERSADKKYQRRHLGSWWWSTNVAKTHSGGSTKSHRTVLVSTTTLATTFAVLVSFFFAPNLLRRPIEFVDRVAWHYSLRNSVPSCVAWPWKSDENLRGKCNLDPYPNNATTVAECAIACCNDAMCITWQYRRDVGCLHGGDLRLGMEKDGPAAWCSDHKTFRWHGQNVAKGPSLPEEEGRPDLVLREEARRRACDERTWDPEQQVGQCLGLGDVRPEASRSAKECMQACCEDITCHSWQWNEVLGCFYGGVSCTEEGKEGDAVMYEPFIGRRKRLDSRSYTGPDGTPWQMKRKDVMDVIY